MLRVVLFLLASLSVALPGCATFQREFTPGSLKEGSRIHAFQAASFAYAFNNGHAVQWDARLAMLEKDSIAFLAALDKTPYRMRFAIVPRQNGGPDQTVEYEHYDVPVTFEPKSATAKGKALVLPGAQGTDPAVYERALAPVAAATGLPAETVKRGHFGIFALVTMMSQLNASNDSLKRHAFGLLVLEEKLKRGEQADYLAPLRTSADSIEDVHVALRVIADHHATTAAWRAEVLGLAAMVQAYESPVAMRALGEQIAESRANVARWRESHHQPTMAEFGVAMREFKLPTPENMLDAMDKDGYVTAAIQVAKGVATGSPTATIEGFAKLAPKDSTVRVALDGITAAAKGDVLGATDAVAKLAGKSADVSAITARLDTIRAAVNDVRGGVASARAGASGLPTGIGDAEQRLKKVEDGAASVKRGVVNGAGSVKK